MIIMMFLLGGSASDSGSCLWIGLVGTLKSVPEVRNDDLDSDAKWLQHEKREGLEAQFSCGHHVSTNVHKT